MSHVYINPVEYQKNLFRTLFGYEEIHVPDVTDILDDEAAAQHYQEEERWEEENALITR